MRKTKDAPGNEISAGNTFIRPLTNQGYLQALSFFAKSTYHAKSISHINFLCILFIPTRIYTLTNLISIFGSVLKNINLSFAQVQLQFINFMIDIGVRQENGVNRRARKRKSLQ